VGIKLGDAELAYQRRTIIERIMDPFTWTLQASLLCGFGILVLVGLRPSASQPIVTLLDKMFPAIVDLHTRILSPLLALALGWYFGSSRSSR
jgi:hypothetical protein